MSNPALLNNVLAHSTGRNSRIHGPAHWAGVAAASLTLLDSTPDADPLVVLLFALFHDSMRESDGHDPEHGARGAELARRMRDAGEFKLEEARLLKLEDACTRHDKGRTSTDPTIGTCWDADRLNLWRVMIKPNPALLSTAAGIGLAGSKASRAYTFLGFDWRAIFLNFGAKIAGESPVYLRFGDLPPDGYSCVIGGWGRENGVSVYWGECSEAGYSLDLRRSMCGLETRYMRSLLSRGRPLYLVDGDLAGVGGCGEPVLRAARVVREISPCEFVGILPDRNALRTVAEVWRAEREERPAPMMPVGGEPDERPMFEYATASGTGDAGDFFTSEVRGHLKRWGLLGAYDQYRAVRAPPRQSSPLQASPWKETPWK